MAWHLTAPLDIQAPYHPTRCEFECPRFEHLERLCFISETITLALLSCSKEYNYTMRRRILKDLQFCDCNIPLSCVLAYNALLCEYFRIKYPHSRFAEVPECLASIFLFNMIVKFIYSTPFKS